jgi:hypothetical protein
MAQKINRVLTKENDYHEKWNPLNVWKGINQQIGGATNCVYVLLHFKLVCYK